MRARLGAVALVGAAVAALAIAARQALRTGYGLDRTDEGLYLLAMARPGDDPATVYLFGHLLAPLYRLLGGDVTGLRLAGGAAVAVLSAWLLHAAAEVGGARRWERALAAVVGGGAAAVAFAWFPMTPSYNTVALCGCLLVGIALAGAARPSTAPASTTAPNPVPPDATARADLRRAPRPTPLERGATDAPAPTRAAGPRPGARRGPGAGPAQGTAVRHLARTWGLAGVGVAMAGLGKPTSALAALLVVLLALLALGPARRVTTALLAVGVGVTTTAAAFVVIAGRAPADLSATLLAGSRGVRLLGGHEQLVRLDALVPSSWPAALGFGEPGAWTPTTLQVLLVLPLAALVALLLRLPARAQFGRWRATWRPTTSSSLSRAVVVVTLALLALPFAYVFGTNTNLWSGAGRGAPLWLAALAVATGAGTTRRRAHHSASRAPRPEVAADAIDEHADEAATTPTRTSVSAASRTTPRASTPIPTPEPQEPAAVAGTARPGRADPPPALPPSPPGDTTWRAAPPWAARAGLPLLAATALVGGVTTAAADSYYRYPMPGPGTVTGVVDAAGHRLRLTPRDARDSSALAAAATKGAEAPDGTRVDVAGRDVLDTTGASPGYIWQLGGRALGSDWLIGGYRGSDAAAAHALSLVGCERISQALVLDAPDSPRRIDGLRTLLRRDPERDYRPILTWRHQLGYEVRLLAPTPDAPAVSCPTG